MPLAPFRRHVASASLVLLVLGLATTASAARPTREQLEDASRFLSQATFGADERTVSRLARTGYERWLKREFRARPTSHLRDFARRTRRIREDDPLQANDWRRIVWWNAALHGRDTLRQRVALALSEIFVVSDRNDILADRPQALVSYYDVLVRHALGNYRDLLYDVSRHPAMGIYLSHLNNQRSDAVLNRFPDENYAREVMQLFSIGLHEIDVDGATLVDDEGEPIPTYGNAEVREFAKIFTGFGLGGVDEDGYPAHFGSFEGDWTLPMQMHDVHHEPGEKQLLNGQVVPAGQSGLADFEMAIDNLFQHPNVGPFLARRLIQRLVTSNPTSEYIARVARVFEDDGEGVRGNLGAMVRAILLDPEARDRASLEDPEHGRLREPILRVLRLLRTFRPSGRPALQFQGIGYLLGQYPMNAPSVFNFFQPDFAPPGEIRNRTLVAPEFQISTGSTAIGWANVALYLAAARSVEDERNGRQRPLRMRKELKLARDPEALIDQLDLLLTAGALSDPARATISNTISTFEEPELRLIYALYLFLISPDWNIAQ